MTISEVRRTLTYHAYRRMRLYEGVYGSDGAKIYKMFSGTAYDNLSINKLSVPFFLSAS